MFKQIHIEVRILQYVSDITPGNTCYCFTPCGVADYADYNPVMQSSTRNGRLPQHE